MAGPYRDAMTTTPLGDEQILAVLADYFEYLQRHAPAEEMMAAVLTDDFETGFPEGMIWRGVDGLRDFLAAREGFSTSAARCASSSRSARPRRTG